MTQTAMLLSVISNNISSRYSRGNMLEFYDGNMMLYPTYYFRERTKREAAGGNKDVLGELWLTHRLSPKSISYTFVI